MPGLLILLLGGFNHSFIHSFIQEKYIKYWSRDTLVNKTKKKKKKTKKKEMGENPGLWCLQYIKIIN